MQTLRKRAWSKPAVDASTKIRLNAINDWRTATSCYIGCVASSPPQGSAVAWFSKKDTDAEASAEGSDALLEEIVGSLAAILRVFGEYGFDAPSRDADELLGLCRAWADHLAHGAPLPGGNPSADRLNIPARAWTGATDFFEAQRELERDHLSSLDEQLSHATGRATELQVTLRDFALGLRKILNADVDADAGVTATLDELGEYTASDSVRIDELKTRVVDTIAIVKSAMSERQARHAEQVNRMGQELVDIRDELAQASHRAVRDDLTELYNRGSLDEQLETTVGLCHMTGRPSCLLMIDLDRFKEINDGYGHSAGDAALIALSTLLSSVVLRKSDFVARYGGDEFAVILHNCRLAAAKFIADRLLTAVREVVVDHSGHAFGLTVSIGIAELDTRDSTQTWLDRADDKLREAKEAGRNRVHA